MKSRYLIAANPTRRHQISTCCQHQQMPTPLDITTVDNHEEEEVAAKPPTDNDDDDGADAVDDGADLAGDGVDEEAATHHSAVAAAQPLPKPSPNRNRPMHHTT